MINKHCGDGAVQATAGVISAGDRSIERGNTLTASQVNAIYLGG